LLEIQASLIDSGPGNRQVRTPELFNLGDFFVGVQLLIAGSTMVWLCSGAEAVGSFIRFPVVKKVC